MQKKTKQKLRFFCYEIEINAEEEMIAQESIVTEFAVEE
jgi:hypothetical protein